jgi:hypothetical protein
MSTKTVVIPSIADRIRGAVAGWRNPQSVNAPGCLGEVVMSDGGNGKDPVWILDDKTGRHVPCTRFALLVDAAKRYKQQVTHTG